MRGSLACVWEVGEEGEEVGNGSGFVCDDWAEGRSSSEVVGDVCGHCKAPARTVGHGRMRRRKEEVGERLSD